MVTDESRLGREKRNGERLALLSNPESTETVGWFTSWLCTSDDIVSDKPEVATGAEISTSQRNQKFCYIGRNIYEQHHRCCSS